MPERTTRRPRLVLCQDFASCQAKRWHLMTLGQRYQSRTESPIEVRLSMANGKEIPILKTSRRSSLGSGVSQSSRSMVDFAGPQCSRAQTVEKMVAPVTSRFSK